MSAVSSGSPQGDAGVREPEASDEPRQAEAPDPGLNQADFGANEWLVEELYQRYLADPGSVDRAWWSFFADYQPALTNGTGPQPVLKAAASTAAGPGTVQATPPAPGPRESQGPQARQTPPAAPARPAAPAPQSAPAP